jgi:replication factor C small subunit
MEEFVKIYKPENLEDYICDPELKRQIQAYIDNGMCDPIIFYGPAGTGKTTLAEVIGKELNANVHVVNASTDNGIDVVRSTIVPWAKQSSFTGGMNLIVLDEGERMSTQAQDALKRTMDEFSGICIFIICTNNIHKIIKPLKSRAKETMFKLDYTTDDVIGELVDSIAMKAGMELTGQQLEDVVMSAGGEPRAAVKALQSLSIGTFSPKASKRSDFEKLFTGLTFDEPILDLVSLVTEDDLDALGEYLMLNAESPENAIMIIADTDRALQRSVNKDIHLINMLIQLKEAWE